MPERARFSMRSTVLLVVLLAGGVAVGLWMTVKAHEFYYPSRLYLAIRERDSTFAAEQPGRHEISYRDDLGDLTFEVVSVRTGAAIPVHDFGVLAEAFHTAGWRGHALHVDSPGAYRLSVQPWPNGAEVHLSYTNTEAIARWALGGILLSSACAFAMLLVIGMLRRHGEARRQEKGNPKASDG